MSTKTDQLRTLTRDSAGEIAMLQVPIFKQYASLLEDYGSGKMALPDFGVKMTDFTVRETVNYYKEVLEVGSRFYKNVADLYLGDTVGDVTQGRARWDSRTPAE